MGEEKENIVEPDTRFVEEARQKDIALVDYVKVDEEPTDWGVISNNFIVQVGSSKRVKLFIKTLHDAKVQTERKMRNDLDIKI